MEHTFEWPGAVATARAVVNAYSGGADMVQSTRPPRARKFSPWTQERFLSWVDPQPKGCWRWLGHYMRHGYAVAKVDGHATTAHRLAYVLFVGPIAPELEADHLCSNRWCVNPAHLEAVTHKENMRRSSGYVGQMARATHCRNGHEFTPANIIPEPEGRRRCRTCREAYTRIRRGKGLFA